MIDSYIAGLLIMICIYLILAISLQLSMGFSGLLNLGHIAFFCVGAYTSALLTINGVSFWIAILLSGIISLLVGFLLAVPMKKIKGDYFVLITLGFGFVIYTFAINWVTLTKGPLGISGIPKPSLLGINFSNNINFFILTGIITIISYLIIKRITNSQYGKVLQATRDDELGAKTLGKETFKIRSYALATSAFFAGIAGSLYAHYITFIDPQSFTIFQLIPILTIVIIAGLASLEGTVVATIIIVILPELLRLIGFSPSIIGPINQIIFALLLLIILLYKPKGLFGDVQLD